MPCRPALNTSSQTPWHMIVLAKECASAVTNATALSGISAPPSLR